MIGGDATPIILSTLCKSSPNSHVAVTKPRDDFLAAARHGDDVLSYVILAALDYI